jgi:hypothetical protein
MPQPHLVLTLRGLKDKPAGMLVILGPTEEQIRDTRATEFQISSVAGEKINNEVYLCNMSLGFFIGNSALDQDIKLPSKIPVMHLFVTRNKAVFHDLLFDIWLHFHPTAEPGPLKNFINQEIKGYYSTSLSINGVDYVLQDKINIYPGNQQVMTMFNVLLKTPNMTEMIQKQTELIMKDKKVKYGTERPDEDDEEDSPKN